MGYEHSFPYGQTPPWHRAESDLESVSISVTAASNLLGCVQGWLCETVTLQPSTQAQAGLREWVVAS